VPDTRDIATLVILVIRLNLSAFKALSDIANEKIFTLTDRQINAKIGNPIRPISTKLGRISCQLGTPSVVLR
jgi:hypothetical protein